MELCDTQTEFSSVKKSICMPVLNEIKCIFICSLDCLFEYASFTACYDARASDLKSLCGFRFEERLTREVEKRIGSVLRRDFIKDKIVLLYFLYFLLQLIRNKTPYRRSLGLLKGKTEKITLQDICW
jgi:hypothetical protein